jgi:tetratricopeptide (TPR) repeat protein
MTPERFRRVEALFNAAITRPQAQRVAFLEANEPDPDIRADVVRLLEHAQTPGPHPLETKLQAVETSPATPQRIGPYRLLRQIGEGGMGDVFLAERDVEGIARRVALKLLHGMPTESGKRRMARERELLAGLHHPHIASLIDGGLTGDGQPYLVMDYVEGTTLADYLAARRPSLADRVRLHLQCCDAVQHAHQRLVLHRDIKPSNIIVGMDGTPVLLDFGVGKLLEANASSAHTATLAFTPGYAAPEQLHGDTATTATDVFGLGALLFDILTDLRLPTLRKGDAPVPLPSAQVADPARRRELRGDLDRIVTKATARPPEQRYLTAAALGDDLRRFLRGEPVLAAPDALAYRMRKFVGRYRWGVAAGVLVAVALGGFVWRLNAERERALAAEAVAERETRNAKASRDFLVSVLAAADPESVRGKPISVLSLLSTAVAKLRQDRSQDGETRAAAWLAVAEIYSNINDPQHALAALDRTTELLDERGTGISEMRVRVLELRGTMLVELERHEEAMRAMGDMLIMRERLGGDAYTRAQAHRAYAAVALRAAEFAQSETHLDRALALLGPADRGEPGRLRLKLLLDGVRLHWEQVDLPAAETYLRQVKTLAERVLRADDPEWQSVHRAISSVRVDQARYQEALSHARQALAISRNVYGERSRRTATEESEIASVYAHMGRNLDAIAHLERARVILRELDTGADSLASLDIDLAHYYDGRGDYAHAIELLDGALTELPDTPAQRYLLLAAYAQRGSAHSKLGQFDNAWRDFEHALRLGREIGAQSAEYGQLQASYAAALFAAGRVDEAQRALDAARAINREQGIDDTTPLGMRMLELDAKLMQVHGDGAAAMQKIDSALKLAQAHPDTISALQITMLQTTAAEIALNRNDRARARRLLDAAIPVMERQLTATAPQLVNARRLAKM